MAQDLAGDNTLGTLTPLQLYAGEAPIVTSRVKGATGLTFAKFEVYALNAAGEAIKHDPTATAGTAPTFARGIMAQPLTVAASWNPCFTGGAFNHEALVWHASLTTLGARQVAFAGSDIHIEKLL
jgi:hypothetical protein